MPNDSVQLTSPIQFLPGVGPARAEKLTRLRLRTIQDVLFFFPRNYEQPAPSTPVNKLREGQPASIVGVIGEAEITSRTPGKSIFGALVENQSGIVRIVFFNQAFRAESLTFGKNVIVSGTPKLNGLRWEFTHPKVTILGEGEELPKAQILPIYSLTDGVKQIEIRRVVKSIVGMIADEEPLADSLNEVLPDWLRKRAADVLRQRRVQFTVSPGSEDSNSASSSETHVDSISTRKAIDLPDSLPEINQAVRQIHLPDSESELVAARIRFVFQELFVMQLALAIRRRKLTTNLHAPPLVPTPVIDARILSRFPFELTGDQKRVITEVSTDMSRQFPMNRLLQGDVGSGKTVIAVYAMMLAVAGGHQAVLMAPTEVLARQHHRTLTKMLAESRVRIGLLCGSLSAAERRQTIADVAAGEIDILIGTQALLYGEIEFHKLGLCVIDEQHKFGVEQRVALRGGGVDPHYLVMSATPIPRSVAMTMFGDVDLSTLKEKPPGRGKVNTYLAADHWTDRWWLFVRKQLDEGRQAYVVAPRVTGGAAAANETKTVSSDVDHSGATESASSEDVSSVNSVFEKLSTGELRDYAVELLHGSMPNDEKQRVMNDFASGRIQVLVSTTVIEVGIDVPNATVMTILGANHFGLAQLHQLRGRVSRGRHAGHVAVFTDGGDAPDKSERLQVFEKCDDGFDLAEADFRMRGPGDLIGKKQSGLPPMRVADLMRDEDVLIAARELAQELIDEAPDLISESKDMPGLDDLREQVYRRYGKRLDLGDVA